ncbi:MAG: O-antigen ligase family protein [Steroidobacter sp.]
MLILLHFAVAVISPSRFILLALWVQTIPYTWNWDAQMVFDTPIGPLNVVAMQVFGFLFSSMLVVGRNISRLREYAPQFSWHLVFMLFCVVSLSYAPSVGYGIRMIAKLLGPLMFALALVCAMESREDLERAETAIIGSGVILIALAVVAKAMGVESDPNAVNSGQAGLGPPSMGPPVFSAHMLAVSMLALAIYLRDKKLRMLLMALLSALCILAAYQRTSAAAMYIGFSAILFVGTRGVWRLLLPVSGVVALPVLIVFSDNFRRRMFFGVNSSNQILNDPMDAIGKINSSGRFSLWDTALRRFFYDHQLLGSGIGSTEEYLHGLTGSAIGVMHSEYVRLMCEMGVIGLLLFAIAMMFYLIKLSVRGRDGNGLINSYTLAALGSLIAYLIYCATDNGFDYVSQFGAYVFGLVAMAFKEHQLTSPAVTLDKVVSQLSRQVVISNLMR